jgi:uncharacterized protein
MPDEAILLSLIFMAALLYSCVGHAGASGYTAILLLYGFAPESIRPAVFVMNICVAGITTHRFVRAGYFDWSFFWPLAVASAPFAFMGSRIKVSAQALYIILGVILFASAIRLLVELKDKEGESKKPVMSVLLLIGGALGLLAGLSGTGGGIFLTPVLIISGWRKAKEAAAISAAFILVNSIAGLVGHYLTFGVQFESLTWLWLIAALLGGIVGSEIGSRRLTPWWLKKVMAVVLITAAYHLVTTKPKTKAKEAANTKSTAITAASPKMGPLVY